MKTQNFAVLSDDELLTTTRALTHRERESTADLVAALSEVDRRRLYLGLGHASLFVYCTAHLRLSEHAAYARIEAARTARDYPVILDLLRDGSLNLTTVAILKAHLTPDNRDQVLRDAVGKSKREVERQVAALRPLPPVPTVIRKLPERTAPPGHQAADPTPAPTREATPAAPQPVSPAAPISTVAAAAPVRRTVLTSLSPETYKLQVTISRETHDTLRRVQDLLRHTVPNGDPAVVLDRALTLLLEHLEKKKCGATDRPRPAQDGSAGSRHVPAAVKRAVWSRDGGRCAFVGIDGRCGERGFLEFHHVEPFACGGATIADNLELRCRAHNVYETKDLFGRVSSRTTRSGPS